MAGRHLSGAGIGRRDVVHRTSADSSVLIFDWIERCFFPQRQDEVSEVDRLSAYEEMLHWGKIG
jgi:hypothetical protein